jgi:hypothetical protein
VPLDLRAREPPRHPPVEPPYPRRRRGRRPRRRGQRGGRRRARLCAFRRRLAPFGALGRRLARLCGLRRRLGRLGPLRRRLARLSPLLRRDRRAGRLFALERGRSLPEDVERVGLGARGQLERAAQLGEQRVARLDPGASLVERVPELLGRPRDRLVAAGVQARQRVAEPLRVARAVLALGLEVGSGALELVIGAAQPGAQLARLVLGLQQGGVKAQPLGAAVTRLAGRAHAANLPDTGTCQ